MTSIIQSNIKRRKDACFQLQKTDTSHYQAILLQAMMIEIRLLENQLNFI